MKIWAAILYLMLGAFWQPALGQAKYAGELFEAPGAGRSVAMGGIGVSTNHGAATGLYNPSLVGQQVPTSMMLARREQFGGTVSADLVATTLPVRNNLAVQLGILRRGVDRIPDTRSALDDLDGDGLLSDNEILVADDVRYFNQREWGVVLSMSRRDQSGWQWGLGAKLLGHWLADESGLGVGFDLGLYRVLGLGLSLGIMLQDVTTTQIHWSTGRWETTAPRITAGMEWQFLLPVLDKRVVLAVEGTTRLDGERMERDVQLGPVSLLSRAGLELVLNENLRLRAGHSTQYPVTVGAGLDFPAFGVDYAYVADARDKVFDPTHQISLTLYLETLQRLLDTG